MLYDAEPMIEFYGVSRVVNYLWYRRGFSDTWCPVVTDQKFYVKPFGWVNERWNDWDSYQPNNALRKAALEYLEVIDTGGFILLRKRA
jgi:hypothetical protein